MAKRRGKGGSHGTSGAAIERGASQPGTTLTPLKRGRKGRGKRGGKY